MAAAQRGEGGQEGLRAVKPFNRQPDHLHQLAPLFLHVAFKKRPERGIEFEQTAIEQGGGRIRYGPDSRKASLHQCLLNHIHNHSPYFVAYGICGLRRRRVLGFEAGDHRPSPITDGNGKADCSLKEKNYWRPKVQIRLKVIGSRAARKKESRRSRLSSYNARAINNRLRSP